MPVAVDPADFTWGAEGPAAVVERIREACVAVDHNDPLNEAAELHLKHHGLAGSRLWISADVGFALLHDGLLDLAVAPDARGRGRGQALAITALADGAPVNAWSHGDHPAAAELAAQFHLERVRELWVMRRPTSDALPEPTSPDGVLVRGFRPGDEDELIRVNAAAFAAHPEQAGMDAENLAERMAEPWFDPAGLLVADRDGRMLGFHWTKRHSEDLGEVYVVGIAPEAQGMGLGKVLTLAGLHHLADAGVSEVLLYVESDNAPAISLYSGLGFTHAAPDTHVMYRR